MASYSVPSRIAALAAGLLVVTPLDASALDFSEHFNGAMRIDGESTWFYAEGQIEVGDTERFETFLEGRSIWKNQRIVFNSPGGNILEGMRLGAAIRSKGFRTAVAKTTKGRSFSEVSAGICASSCVLAFAGGVQRGASEGSRVGVHQMSVDFTALFSRRDVTVADLSANFSEAQKAVSLVLTHFMSMGIDPSIVELMTGASASDIRWLTVDEAKRTKVAYEPREFTPWAIEPYGNGLIAFSRSNDTEMQLTLFCRNAQMRFLLRAEGPPYSTRFAQDVKGLKAIEIAGVTVAVADFKVDLRGGALELSGLWKGVSGDPKSRSVFSLYGHVVGSLSDLYSAYHFNPARFEASADLARKNCV